METWQLAVVILLALIVGALIPALIQLQITLRSVQQTSQLAHHALGEARDTLAHVKHFSATVSGHSDELANVLGVLGDLSDASVRLRGGIQTASRIGATIGPVIAAAIGALGARASGDASSMEMDGDLRNPETDLSEIEEAHEDNGLQQIGAMETMRHERS